ncbi:unnamed protein product [Dovyalis caffra]|uniref:Uncharacterized protein n=1 Tax=Dovyalis caffra TaxID=77055 RepID=A0AAV1S583_9ROSI|nr:unnamed protein product [Dovyalis caffra]
MASVPDIKAISYDVCGVVSMVGSGYKAKVALTHGPENVKPQVRQTDGNGNFCFESMALWLLSKHEEAVLAWEFEKGSDLYKFEIRELESLRKF